MKLVVASHNRDKLREIKSLFTDVAVNLVDLDGYPEFEPVEETGTNLEENALLKARETYKAIRLAAIADDTGLEVAALDGAPGVYSARYAGPGASYSDNVTKLLADLTGVEQEQRKAKFKTCAVYVDQQIELIAEGEIAGYITDAPKGSNGFGYDPIFFVPELGKTFGEMTAAEKQEISHRKRAFYALKQSMQATFPEIISKEKPA
ncbi:RdgB/HAM1 family non-canonical purine NTP pyrophosphatase [Candidatus Neomarinimicrobiota bacterium]